MKLKKLLSKAFEQRALKATANANLDFETLEGYLPTIFPEDTDWGIILEVLEVLDRKDTERQNADFLPFHTRDEKWLAKYVYSTVKEAEPETAVKFANVKKFVATSRDFDAFRRRYEENLTREQIKFIYNDYVFSGENAYFRHLDDQKNNLDKAFRNEVVKTLTYMGVDEHSVEIGLEKNADLWRERTMLQSFNNRFYPENREDKNDKSLWRNNPHNMREHRDAWLRLRECMYYQEHKDIIDELGLATKNMRMSDHECINLSSRVIDFYKKHYNIPTNTLENDIKQKKQFGADKTVDAGCEMWGWPHEIE